MPPKGNSRCTHLRVTITPRERGTPMRRSERRTGFARLNLAVAKELQLTVEVAQPIRVLNPTGAREEMAGKRIVIQQGRLKITQAGLMGVGPKDLIRESETAAHQEA